jgi:hypothetical protein
MPSYFRSSLATFLETDESTILAKLTLAYANSGFAQMQTDTSLTWFFATEFEIQGLELDWVGLCWSGDFIWSNTDWIARNLHYGSQSKWSLIRSIEKQTYRKNAYRVLLTRARQGMVIYVPRGDSADPTRQPDELNRIANYLLLCGVDPLPNPGPAKSVIGA